MGENGHRWSPAGAVIDFYDDVEVGAIRGNEKLACELRDVTCLEAEEVAKLADSDFALIIETPRRRLRKYPIHDSDHVKLAVVYLRAHGDVLPPAAKKIASENIARAIQRELGQGIPELQNVYRTYDDHEKTATVASKPIKWALVKEGKKTKRYYPCGTPYECGRSMEHFEQTGMSFQPSDRRKIACNLSAKAAEFDMETKPDGLIDRYSGDDWNPRFRAHFLARKEALDREPDACKVLDELAENLMAFTKTSAVKLLETFDRDCGLDRLWGKKDYPDPYVTVYGHVAEKTAVDVKGLGPVEEAEIRKIAETEGLLEEVVGTDGAAMFRDDPVTVFQSLPQPTQTFLLQRNA